MSNPSKLPHVSAAVQSKAVDAKTLNKPKYHIHTAPNNNSSNAAILSGAKDSADAGFGALLGACIGDSCGSLLEFIGHKPSASEVVKALEMPGGGCHGVASGQVTDDGELTLCQARALCESYEFNADRLAYWYSSWKASAPFDIGSTCRASMGKAINMKVGGAVLMSKAANSQSMESKANGGLMRSSPIGVYLHALSATSSNTTETEMDAADAYIADCASTDSGLSHPNQCCRQTAALYSIAIAHLVSHPSDRSGAIKRVKRYASKHGNADVQQWLREAEDRTYVAAHPLAGFVRIGFTYAFRHLMDPNSDYLTAIRDTLSEGGDSDTNAAIVGGLIGAASGASNLPAHMKDAVIHCNTHRKTGVGAGRRPRPAWLSTNDLELLTTKLMQANKYRIPSATALSAASSSSSSSAAASFTTSTAASAKK